MSTPGQPQKVGDWDVCRVAVRLNLRDPPVGAAQGLVQLLKHSGCAAGGPGRPGRLGCVLKRAQGWRVLLFPAPNEHKGPRGSL